MKKLLIASLLVPMIAHAVETRSENKPIKCGVASEIIPLFLNEFNEKLSWTGNSAKSKFALLVNPTNDEWTILEFNNETACIIGSGTASTPLNSKKKSVDYR